MPRSLQITDSDIKAVEKTFACLFSDQNRRQAILANTTCDIQAGPGSGKTTLLAAKLVILMSKWTWPDRGICVLSHTNAARDEIERRLVRHPTAYRLLGYPHFVGTIQKFVDQYLGIPFIENKALSVSMIDNEQFAVHALKQWPRYHKAHYSLSKRADASAIIAGLRYEYRDSEFKLGSAMRPLPVREQTATYRELLDLKNSISHKGIFRFDDMFAFSEAYVEENPWMIDAVRYRFPWVFVDEMQDTDLVQDSLLCRLFGYAVTLQRFGDVNQGIFGGDQETEGQRTFPQQGCVELGESKRFGDNIAKFASCLTAEKPQTLIGRKNAKEPIPTVFLFNNGTIHNVISAFGDLVADYYGSSLPKGSTVKAIGFRRSGTDESKVPYTIADYWDGYVTEVGLKAGRPKRLVDFVRSARHAREQSQECRDAHRLVLDGLLHLLREMNVMDREGKGFTKRSLKEALLILGKRDEFDELIALLCLPSMGLRKEPWALCMSQLEGILECIGIEEDSLDGADFLQWSDIGGVEISTATKAEESLNTYRHQTLCGPIDIEVTTIHSVKGQTHTATLILETYFNKVYDLKYLLPFLKGKGTRTDLATDKRLKEHMKRVFVGMTRPSDVLCLAIHKDHLDPGDEADLQFFGWNIRDLTLGEGMAKRDTYEEK